MRTSLSYMRPIGAVYAGTIAVFLLVGGIVAASPSAILGAVVAATACVLSGWGGRLVRRPRDPHLTLAWQSALCAVLVVGALLLAALV